MTWIGNIFIVLGLYLIGEKKRVAFVFSMIGELIWMFASVHKGMWDLAVITAVFFLLALINYIKWGKAPTAP
jgi:hypothetical protein